MQLRCYIRINGVRARLIDTRYVCHRDRPHVVVREQSWREGSWVDLVGEGVAAHLPSDLVNDRVAAEKLPLLRSPECEEMQLAPPRDAMVDAHTSTPLRPLVGALAEQAAEGRCLTLGWAWRAPARRCEALCASRGLAVIVHGGGVAVEAVDLLTGTSKWTRPPPAGSTIVMAAALSPSADDGGRVALGTERGWAHVWNASTGEALVEFAIAPHTAPRGTGAASAGHWVEHLVWDADGRRLGVAAGRDVAIAHAATGEVVSRTTGGGTVYALEFGTGGASTDGHGTAPSDLAYGAYGGVGWLQAVGGGCSRLWRLGLRQCSAWPSRQMAQLLRLGVSTNESASLRLEAHRRLRLNLQHRRLRDLQHRRLVRRTLGSEAHRGAIVIGWVLTAA